MGYEEQNTERKFGIKRVGDFKGYFVIVMLYIMIGLYSVIRSLNYGKWLEAVLVGNLLLVTGMMLLTALASWMLCLYFECEDYSLKDFLVFSLVLMLTVYMDSRYLSDTIARCLTNSENRWIYELTILPINAIFIFKLTMAIENKWSFKNNLVGLLSFVCWNVFLGHISHILHMSYQGSLVVINTIIFGAALFTAKTEKKNYGNRFAILGLYIGAMILSLYLRKDEFVSIKDYLFNEPGFPGYVAAVRTLFSNVKWIGSAYDGISIELDFLKYSANPIHSICAYFGMIPAVFYFLLLLTIMAILGVTVYRVRKDRVYFAVGMSAYANLIMRMILGTLFSLGLFPLQIEMPFAADENFIFDFCSCAVLLMIYFKNKSENGYTALFCKNSSFKEMIEFLMLEEEEWEDIEDDEMY